MKLNKWLKDHVIPGSITAPPMTVGDAISILKDEILGEDWYVSYPCNDSQVLTEAIADVVDMVKWLKRPWYIRWFSKR